MCRPHDKMKVIPVRTCTSRIAMLSRVIHCMTYAWRRGQWRINTLLDIIRLPTTLPINMSTPKRANILDAKTIHLAVFYRIPPGDIFHYGIYANTVDSPKDYGVLYHVTNRKTASYVYDPDAAFDFEASGSAVAAMKVGDLTDKETSVYLVRLSVLLRRGLLICSS